MECSVQSIYLLAEFGDTNFDRVTVDTLKAEFQLKIFSPQILSSSMGNCGEVNFNPKFTSPSQSSSSFRILPWERLAWKY